MREGTSGLLFTQNADGSVRLEVVDYGVEEFGGGDWESWYELDKINAGLLKKELEKSRFGSFRDMLIAEFGEGFSVLKFERFCNERGIKYSHASWF